VEKKYWLTTTRRLGKMFSQHGRQYQRRSTNMKMVAQRVELAILNQHDSKTKPLGFC